MPLSRGDVASDGVMHIRRAGEVAVRDAILRTEFSRARGPAGARNGRQHGEGICPDSPDPITAHVRHGGATPPSQPAARPTRRPPLPPPLPPLGFATGTNPGVSQATPQAEVRGEKMARVVQAVYSVHLESGAFLVCLNHALSTEQDEGLEGQLSC